MKQLRISQPIAASALLIAAGCTDSGPGRLLEPPAPAAARVEMHAGANQAADAGTPVAIAPTVLVKTVSGQPAAGVLVRFVILQGGGSVDQQSATTDAQGMASAGGWTLGATPGVNELEAVVGSLPAVRFTATATAPVSSFNYQITVNYIAAASLRQKQAVLSAVARWQSIITQDLTNIPVNAPAGTCFAAQPAFNDVVDDVLIFVELVAIDGVGKTLGEAGPCYVRTDNGLPVVGHLKLDSDDLLQMESRGTLDDVVLHEIGHVLGIGTLWTTNNLLTGAGTTDPLFIGTGALDAYRLLGGSGSGVPVENSGAAGTRDGHWRESVFGNELMTGWIAGALNPVSALTIASLQDLGYGANPGAANSYALGGTAGSLSAGVDLKGREHMKRPKFKVDRKGRREKIAP